MNQRNRSIDVLKGIGIIFVIMGHIDYTLIGGGIISYIYSFHIPLFFWVSGYLSYNSKNKPLKEFFVGKLKTVILPYIILFWVSIFYGNIIVRYVFKLYVIPFNLFDTLKALLLSSEWLNTVPTFNFPLWFLPTFFISVMIFYFITKIKKTIIFTFLIILLILITVPIQNLFPGRQILGFNVLPASLAFMGLGYLFKKYENKIKVHYMFLLPILFVTILLAYKYSGNIQAIKNYFYYLTAVSGIYFYYRVANDLSSSRALSFLGRNSLVIFGIHAIVSNTYPYTKIGDYFSQSWNGSIVYIVNLIYILTCCTVVCYAINLVKKSLIHKFKLITKSSQKYLIK
jgi:acyltransferase